MLKKNTILLILASLFFLAGCSASAGNADGKAPDFSLQSLKERTVRLSDYEGKVIVLNFFATWCPPCRTEIPDFIELVNEHNGNLAIIGISVDRGGVETVRSFAREFKINYPVLMDDGLTSEAYGPIRSIPTTFIIDKKGNIVKKIIGARNKAAFEELIRPLL